MTMNRAARNALFFTSAALMLLTLYLVFIWVPTERNLGISQRIFYFHVALAWVGFLAFFWVLVGSVGYLWKRSRGWDRLAYASAEIGVVFTTLMLVTGVMWAKPVWGVWWSWDPKLTTHDLAHTLAHLRRVSDAAGVLPGRRPGFPLRRRAGHRGLCGRADHLPVRGLVAHDTSAGRPRPCCGRWPGAVDESCPDGLNCGVHFPVRAPAPGPALSLRRSEEDMDHVRVSFDPATAAHRGMEST